VVRRPLGPRYCHGFEQLAIWAPSRFQLYLGLFVFSVNNGLFVSAAFLILFYYSLPRISVGCRLDVTGSPWLWNLGSHPTESRMQLCSLSNLSGDGIALPRRLMGPYLRLRILTLPSSPLSRMSIKRFASLAADILSRQEDGETAPQTPRHGNPVVAFIIGLAIILLASILNAAGLNLTKLDHVRRFRSVGPAVVCPDEIGCIWN